MLADLFHLKAQRRWQNAENHAWDEASQSLLRGGYFSIKHEQEQVGDRQTFALSHDLFGLKSKTLVGMDYNRIHFNLHSNSPYHDVDADGQPIDLYHPDRGQWQSASPYRNSNREDQRRNRRQSTQPVNADVSLHPMAPI